MFFLVGYGDNPNWRWNTVYLQGFSGNSFFTWSTTFISGTIPSGNEWPSWSDMKNISNYLTFNYGSRTGLWLVNTYLLNIHDWSYVSCSTNKTIGKSGWWTNYSTQTRKLYKIFSIKPTFFFMCCTKGKCTCWQKGVKYASSFTKGYSGYLRWDSKTFKRAPHLHT